MLLFELILLCILGFLFFCLGLFIWKKEAAFLIHSYHHKNVKEHDKKAYCEKMGKGLCLIAIGTMFTGLINYFTNTFWGWLLFGVCFIVAFAMFHLAQMKYNGSWFS